MGQVIDISENKIAGGGGSSSPVIAYALGVNLKNVGANPFTWMPGKSAANTGNHRLYARLSSNQTYDGDGDAGAKSVCGYTAGATGYPTVGQTVVVKRGGETIGTFVATNNVTSLLFHTNDLNPFLVAHGFTVAMGAYPNVVITNSVVGTADEGEAILVYVGSPAGSYISTSGLEGGVDPLDPADYSLTLNGDEIPPYIGALMDGIAGLVFEVSSFSTPIKKSGQQMPMVGDYDLNVASGTVDDFVVDFYISADTI